MVDTTKPRRGSITAVTLAIGNNKLIGPSEKRRAISFVIGGNNSGTSSVNNRPTTGPSDGIWGESFSPGVPMRYEDFGDLVCGPWFIWSTAANDVITIIESLEV